MVRLPNVYLGSSKIQQELIDKQDQTQNLSWKSLEAVLGQRYIISEKGRSIFMEYIKQRFLIFLIIAVREP